MVAAGTGQPGWPATTRLSAEDVGRLDPYAFLAVLGKHVIHPGGRRSTQELLDLAGLAAGQQVLDIGCGVATTAIQVARRFGAQVTAADLSPLMLGRAQANVARAGLDGQVTVEQADILALPYPDGAIDRVIAEAVTMFVDRPRAAAELVRVCRPGGRVLATEFCWRRPPTPQARQVFLGEVCPGLQVDTIQAWASLYRAAGLGHIQVTAGPFEMMTMRGFLADEGPRHALAVVARSMSRPSYLAKMGWLMPRMHRAIPYLGYVVIAGTRQPGNQATGASSMTNVIHPVDVERLPTEAQAKYREVAADYHFHTGRVHARRLGYPPSPLDQLPEAAREAFAGVANPFHWTTPSPASG